MTGGARLAALVGVAATYGALVVGGWIAAASYIYLWGVGRLTFFRFPFDQWLIVAPYWRLSWWITLWLVAGAALSAVIPISGFMLCAVFLRRRRKLRPPLIGGLRKQERGVTHNHGDARWLTESEMQRMFPEGPGIVIGEAYRVDEDRCANLRFDPRNRKTWGKGGTARLLVDSCLDGPTHSMMFAGSGSFKTQESVVTLLNWVGSAIIIDPKAELGPMLKPELERRGNRVYELHTKGSGGGINVLDWIDPTDPEAEIHVQAIVSLVYEEDAAKDAAAAAGKSRDPFFTSKGKDLVTCILAHLIWSDIPADQKTLISMREGLCTPESEMARMLQMISGTSNSKMARNLASTLMETAAPQTFAGVYANAVGGTSWLSVSAYANLVSGTALRSSQILAGDTTVFLQISLSALATTPALARVLLGAFLNRVIIADGETNGRILFLIDEAARLGPMKAIEVIRDAGRGYGATLHMLWQSIGQMEAIWGKDGLAAWIDSSSWYGFASIRSPMAAKLVTENCGTHAVLAYSEGDNRGQQNGSILGRVSRSSGWNTNVHEIKRALISSDELYRLRDDEKIVFHRGCWPIRCGRALWFRRPEIKAIVGENRFLQRAS